MTYLLFGLLTALLAFEEEWDLFCYSSVPNTWHGAWHEVDWIESCRFSKSYSLIPLSPGFGPPAYFTDHCHHFAIADFTSLILNSEMLQLPNLPFLVTCSTPSLWLMVSWHLPILQSVPLWLLSSPFPAQHSALFFSEPWLGWGHWGTEI